MVSTAALRLEAVLGLFLVLTWLFTGLRVYVRCLVSKGWGADDSLLLAALVGFTAYIGCAFYGISYGIGQHTTDIPKEDVPQGMMSWWLFQLLYIVTTMLLRCSIALFILRICSKRIHKTIIHVTMAMVLIFSIFYLALLIFQCQPVNYFWTQYTPLHSALYPEGKCLDLRIFQIASYAHCAVSATTDWVLGILPVWLVWNLRMNFRTKLSIGILLSFGMMAGIATIIRIPFIYLLPVTNDFFYIIVDVAIWSTVEPGIGIIATAACVLRPLVKRFSGSSKNGTCRIRETPNHHSTWQNKHASVDHLDGMQHQDAKKNNTAVESVVTSVLAGHKRERGREWKKKSGAVQNNKLGNESEEELTGEGKGILVHKMVEIRRQKNVDGQKGEASMESLDLER